MTDTTIEVHPQFRDALAYVTAAYDEISMLPTSAVGDMALIDVPFLEILSQAVGGDVRARKLYDTWAKDGLLVESAYALLGVNAPTVHLHYPIDRGDIDSSKRAVLFLDAAYRNLHPLAHYARCYIEMAIADLLKIAVTDGEEDCAQRARSIYAGWRARGNNADSLRQMLNGTEPTFRSANP